MSVIYLGGEVMDILLLGFQYFSAALFCLSTCLLTHLPVYLSIS